MKLDWLSWAVCVLLYVAAWACPAVAQVYDPQTGDPPPGSHVLDTYNEWSVAPTADGKGINGTVRLDCYHDEYDEVFVRVKGLVPRAKYTVWMVNQHEGEAAERAGVARHWDGPMASEYYFQAERDGRGFYRGWLQHCPLGTWKWLEIRRHPNGNVADLETSVTVVRVRIKPR